MADNRYIVTHSNYTIKKKHKSLSGDTIYERDYMTTTNLGGFDSGSIPWGEGNFRIVYNEGKNLKRKHKYGEWLKNENCEQTSTENCEVFTLSNMPSNTSAITSEGKIVIKENKNNFFDFVYYGSCEEMIRSAVDDIIVKFPAELYVTNKNYTYLDNNDETAILGGKDWVIIENPFDIDIYSSSPSKKQKDSPEYNPFRFFSETVSKYRIIDKKNEDHCINTWDVDLRQKNCFRDGDITAVITINSGETTEMVIRRYYKNGDFVLLVDKSMSNYRIRPTEGAIINFFNDIDDFERFLLNRESNPQYSITIDTPRETNKGISYIKETYTWPTDHEYNLDLSSGAFTRYYTNLMKVAEWYDENRVNNLWRNMTHESIKNMDRTYTDTSSDENNEDYQIGTTQVHNLLNVWGRQFDDMKRYIGNIKSVNNVTYDENNNTPDYFLTDSLELSGWDIRSAVETLDAYTKTGILYSGTNKKWDVSAANLQFFRNLKLNSRALFSRKGTKEAIEMLLSLFGLCSYDWARKYYNAMPNNLKKTRGRKVLSWDDLSAVEQEKMYDYSLDEYVATITNSQDDVVYMDDQLPVEKYTQYRKDFSAPDDENILYGLPIRLVTVAMSENGQQIVKKYMIPWFSKQDTLDGNPYFQMYGGWGKALKRDVVPDKELYPNVTEIETIPGFTIYDETKKYLKIVNDIKELSEMLLDEVNDGDIFYVNDITNFNDYYPDKEITGATNYFTIANHNNLDVYGTDLSGKTGWENITKETLSCENESNPIAYKVIYLESIVETNTGNNPHVGYGDYDDGEEFLNYVRQTFRGAITNDGFSDEAYDCETGEILDEILNVGFAVRQSAVDNMKVWYFTDNTRTGKIFKLQEVNETIYDGELDASGNPREFVTPVGYEIIDNQEKVNVGKIAYNNSEVGFKSELMAFNLETQEDGSNDEASANSIINVKKLLLKFNNKYTLQRGFKDYLYTVILPYVKQLVPSTAIFEVILDNSEVDYACFNFADVTGMSK